VKKPILVVTTHFVRPVETRIDNEFEVRRKADGTPFQHGELLATAEGADALLITPFDRLDADFFKRVSPSVKVISTYSVGVDHIDLQAVIRLNVLYFPFRALTLGGLRLAPYNCPVKSGWCFEVR
jgi:lactate dehydrogenase-like 2-hydroxyacid dehydrogenase